MEHLDEYKYILISNPHENGQTLVYPFGRYNLPRQISSNYDDSYLPSLRLMYPHEERVNNDDDNKIDEKWVLQTESLLIKKDRGEGVLIKTANSNRWIRYSISNNILKESHEQTRLVLDELVTNILWLNRVPASWDTGLNAVMCLLLRQPYGDQFIKKEWQINVKYVNSMNDTNELIMTEKLWFHLINVAYKYCKNNGIERIIRNNHTIKKLAFLISDNFIYEKYLHILLMFLVITQNNRSDLIHSIFNHILYDDVMEKTISTFLGNMKTEEYIKIYEDAFSTL